MEHKTLFSDPPAQPALSGQRCLRSRLNTNQCQRCLESCCHGALSVSNRKIALDTARCTGCMSCVAACPQDALTTDQDVDELLKSFQSGADIVVSCSSQVQNHPGEIILPCVGILSRQAMVAMLFSGCSSITFNVTGCAGCRNREISSVFAANFRQIIEGLSDIPLSKVVFAKEREQLSKLEVDRRSYLAKIFDIAVDVSIKHIMPKQLPHTAKPENKRRIPSNTRLLKKVFSKVDGDCQAKLLDLFCHKLSINEDCNCCPLCKGICPTGAISIDRSEKGKSFTFERLDCSGCGLCVEFCKKKALSFEARPDNVVRTEALH